MLTFPKHVLQPQNGKNTNALCIVLYVVLWYIKIPSCFRFVRLLTFSSFLSSTQVAGEVKADRRHSPGSI